MSEPVILGIPLSTLFLYFIWYSFLGWCMETAYCSLKARHFVFRGFLEGPICPIYGVGALIMVLFFTPLTGYPLLFYLVACVTMSAWEYLVAWLLETTTHVKYWDYSHLPWNLHGRICLFIGLWWGVAAFLAIYLIHPATEQLFSRLVPPASWWIAGILALITLSDTVTTIRKLALTTHFLELAEQARVELAAKRQELQLTGRQVAETAKLRASLAAMELRHSDLVSKATHYSKRFRRRYRLMSTLRYKDTMARIREEAARLRQELKSELKKR